MNSMHLFTFVAVIVTAIIAVEYLVSIARDAAKRRQVEKDRADRYAAWLKQRPRR